MRVGRPCSAAGGSRPGGRVDRLVSALDASGPGRRGSRRSRRASPSATVGRACAPGRSVGSWNDDTSTRSRRRERRAARRRRRPPAPSGRSRARAARFLISTFTSSPRAHVEGLAQRRDLGAGRRSARGRRARDERATRRGAASWCTTSSPSARAAHVELHAVGPQRHGPREGLEGVLGRRRARAAVGEHERPGRSPSTTHAFIHRRLRKPWSDSLGRRQHRRSDTLCRSVST